MMEWSRYPNFKPAEFACSHCGENEIQEELLDRLQALRNRYGRPMRITSGYRCSKHPIEAKKPSPGPHSSGLACDVGVEGADAHRLLGLALDAGFKGIGVQQKGTGRFLHLDLVEGPNRPTVWSY
jgi:zinc D-Ala-D-Ala carboxypeptidase